MNLLLDSHAVVWWLLDEPLDPIARQAIADPARLVAVSAVSIWELEIERSLGRLTLDGSLTEALQEFERLDIRWEHAAAAAGLPPHHRDPFDRMLVAQAQIEGLTLVTRDRVIDAYEVEVLRC